MQSENYDVKLRLKEKKRLNSQDEKTHNITGKILNIRGKTIERKHEAEM